MSELCHLTIIEAQKALQKGTISARELAEAHISAIEASKNLNAFVTETRGRAIEDAVASDERRSNGNCLGPLDGIPLAIKDLFCTEGVLTTAGSRMLEDFVPPYESTVSQNLRNAGGVMLGKTNLDEFAMGSSNETSFFGPVQNPWKNGNEGAPLVPGGSSGGSASAVAGRMCIGAIGTDTGGSIRQPAAFCGIVGMKPTYGRCSRWGVVAFASSLDQAGPMARTVGDVAILLHAMAGFDKKDSTSAEIEVPDFQSTLRHGVRGLRVGIPQEYAIDGMNEDVRALWERGREWLKSAGAEIVPITLPHTKYALPAYYIIAPAEASSNLARYDGVRYGRREDGEDVTELYEKTRGGGFGQEVLRRILIGTYALSSGYYDAYYLKAQKVRALIARDFSQAYEKCDVILTPTTPGPAFAAGEKSEDPIAMYLNDVLTVPASLAGLPAISVPAGLSDNGLPLGLHLIGRAFDEATMFRAAQVLEDAAAFGGLPSDL